MICIDDIQECHQGDVFALHCTHYANCSGLRALPPVRHLFAQVAATSHPCSRNATGHHPVQRASPSLILLFVSPKASPGFCFHKSSLQGQSIAHRVWSLPVDSVHKSNPCIGLIFPLCVTVGQLHSKNLQRLFFVLFAWLSNCCSHQP
jgi:hypothetical protein